MDPLQISLSTLSALLPQSLQRQGLPTMDSSVLMALLNQDVMMLFELMDAGKVQLKLPTGQTIQAQGELPFPIGTEIRVRIQPAPTGETGLRLQVLEAMPPPSPSLLLPLQQSEAATLASRLQEPIPPPELRPLVELLKVLGYMPEPTASEMPPSLPPEKVILQALAVLPPSLYPHLATVLDQKVAMPPTDLARVIEMWIQKAMAPQEADAPTKPDRPEKPLPTKTDAPLQRQGSRIDLPRAVEKLEQLDRVLLSRQIEQPIQKESESFLFEGLLYRFKILLDSHPEIPEDSKHALDQWLRSLIQKSQPEARERPPSGPRGKEAPQASAANPQEKSAKSPPGVWIRTPEAHRLQTALRAHAGPPAELPETWEAWIRGSTKVLSDPISSPKEAPFHAIQGKEMTAFYEIPLPWMGQAPLQLWVEADPPDQEKSGETTNQRILLGLHFTGLGETRVGLERSASLLQVRIWAEHPEALRRDEAKLLEELEGLGKRVTLKILPLGPGEGGIPSLRTIVTGPSLHAMG